MNSLFSIRLSLLATSALLLLLACGDDTAQTTERIKGKWELVSATRGGQATTSLDQLYFEFAEGGVLRTNLSGMEETAVYSVSANNILQRESQFEVDYSIQDLSDSTLALSATINNYNFLFNLRKVPTTNE